jgi:AraC-like DNA-binding protein
VEGVPEAVRLTAGDCFLLSRGLASLLASDLTLSAAITSIHDEPTHDWTVEELAQRTGMSRSTFALMFKQTVGVSPIDYLTRWRMLLV